MFSYYGSKSKIVDYYPPPRHSKIIEPFAGSARYALKYFDREVLLVDKYPVIIQIWQWLQQCREKDILGLPNVVPGQKMEFDVCDEARNLIAFNCNRGSSSPHYTAGRYHDIESVWNFRKGEIAKNLHKIRHWQFRVDDYRNLENDEATWFIDPPYQYGGEHYIMKNTAIDFDELADWCKSREGQVIVCENSKADWLPFNPMRKLSGQKYTTTEAIWTNLETSYAFEQLTIF